MSISFNASILTQLSPNIKPHQKLILIYISKTLNYTILYMAAITFTQGKEIFQFLTCDGTSYTPALRHTFGQLCYLVTNQAQLPDPVLCSSRYYFIYQSVWTSSIAQHLNATCRMRVSSHWLITNSSSRIQVPKTTPTPST
jgi:hypothetical protein